MIKTSSSKLILNFKNTSLLIIFENLAISIPEASPLFIIIRECLLYKLHELFEFFLIPTLSINQPAGILNNFFF